MPKFQVQRSITINAAPDEVFDKVADFGTWTTWSPWLCAEPTAEVQVSEDSSSVGSMYSWSGEIVGAGEIEHRVLERGRLIDDEIRFLKPFKSQSNVGFSFQPAGGGTEVTWSMGGSLPWFMFWMTGMMETFIGMDYDRGLKMLKEWIETGEIQAKTTIRGVESVGPLRMAGVRRSCSVREVGESMQEAFTEVEQQFAAHNLPTNGGGISVYHHFDIKGQRFDYTAGFLLPDSVGEIPSGLSSWSIPQTNALAVEHTGRYDHLGNSWSTANQYARYRKLKQSKVGTFEIYRNTPNDTAPAELRTDIYLPLK